MLLFPSFLKKLIYVWASFEVIFSCLFSTTLCAEESGDKAKSFPHQYLLAKAGSFKLRQVSLVQYMPEALLVKECV